jgi:AAA+ ATPase superfamily predicted ATPase/DNA-binding transcriptional ArsR family regulator
MNPYTNRVMIRDKRFFFDRSEEIEKIFSLIGADRPQSVSVIGKRKTGKSSLLFHVFNKEIAQKHIPSIDDYIFAFVDLQEKREMDVEQFFELLQREIRSHMPDDLNNSIPEVENTYDGFRQMIKKLNAKKKKIVIFMDEFEVVVKNGNFKREFFSFLRSQANSVDLAYVISSKEDFFTFYKRKEIESSDFWNIFTKMWLGLLDRESSLELIKTLSSEEGYPLKDYADYILKLAGDHPFYLQIACTILFGFLKSHGRVSEDDFDQIQEEFQNECWDHFEYFWNNLTEREKNIAGDLVMGKTAEDQNELRSMKNKGILKEENNNFSLFSESFSEFVREKHLNSKYGPDARDAYLFPFPLPIPDFAKIFSAEARERILRYLAKNEAEVADLAHLLDITRPAVEKHLKMLLEFDLIKMRTLYSPRLKKEYIIGEKGKEILEIFDRTEKKQNFTEADFLEIKVGSALMKDEGKHIARISLSAKEKLKITSGTPVLIETENGESVQCEAKTLRGEEQDKVLLDKDIMHHINIRNGDTVILKKRCSDS